MQSALRSMFSRTIAIAAIVGLTAWQPAPQKVYICDSSSSYAYHIDRDCSGLGHCKHRILVVTKQDAINTYGRQACKICAR